MYGALVIGWLFDRGVEAVPVGTDAVSIGDLLSPRIAFPRSYPQHAGLPKLYPHRSVQLDNDGERPLASSA